MSVETFTLTEIQMSACMLLTSKLKTPDKKPSVIITSFSLSHSHHKKYVPWLEKQPTSDIRKRRGVKIIRYIQCLCGCIPGCQHFPSWLKDY